MTAPHLGPGHAVAGRYTIRALLGFTGEAATYDAVNDQGQSVVLKLFDPAIGQRADVMSQLERTQAQVAAMPPDLVVPVFDSGYDVGTSAPFTAGEKLLIPSLAKLVETGPLSPEVVGAVLLGVAKVLDAAHAQQLSHLALKPSNIFVGPSPEYRVRITDFGASVVRRTSPTHEAYALSAPWWAPEQLQPAAVLGRATDVFACALIAFHALTGRSYWHSCQSSPPDLPAWQIEIMGQRVPVSQRAAELGASVPAVIDGVFARAFSVNQPDRPNGVIELANVLAAAGAHYGQQAGSGQPPPTVGFPAVEYPPVSQPHSPEPVMAAAAAPAYPSAPGGYQAAPTAGYVQAAPSAVAPSQAAAHGVTPGLPPIPLAPKKKKKSMLPVIVGVAAAVLLGGAGATFLFMSSPGETETGSAATEGAGGGATAKPAGSAAAGDPSDPGGGGGGSGGGDGTDDDLHKVDVTIQCVPVCDELLIDNEKVEKPSEPQKLLPGKHTVKASKAGYITRTDTIDVPAGKPFEKDYPLIKIQSGPPRPKPCSQFIRPCK